MSGEFNESRTNDYYSLPFLTFSPRPVLVFVYFYKKKKAKPNLTMDM